MWIKMPLLHFATYNLVDLFFFGDVLSKVFGEILIWDKTCISIHKKLISHWLCPKETINNVR